MAAFSSSVFMERNIRFREARSDYDDDGRIKAVTEIASECYLTSVDMWKAGLGKVLLVSRSRCAIISVRFDLDLIV